MKDVMKNFWQPPAKGYDQETMGRTEEQILRWEKACGFQLPALYKAHMQRQNGGLPWPQVFVHGDITQCLFINSAQFTSISDDAGRATLADIYGDEEVNEILGPGCHQDRLYVLSWMYGNGVLCLDYGYNLDAPRQEPEVCYFDTDRFEEVFRVDSYQTFVEHLVYSVACYEGRWHLGLMTELPLEVLANHCAQALSLPLRKRTDDRYGWFNFDAWYDGSIPNYEGRHFHGILSPNRFNAGTWRFPDSPECSFILEINLGDDDISSDDPDDEASETVERSRAIIEGIIQKLHSDSVQAICVMPE